MKLKPFTFQVKRLTKGEKIFVVFIAALAACWMSVPSLFAWSFSQVASSTDIYKGNSVTFTFMITSATSASNVRIYYADGGHESVSYIYQAMTEVASSTYTATITPSVDGNFDYFYFARVDGSNYSYCSSGTVTSFQIARDNPFSVRVTEPDFTPPYIVHQPDEADDEDDGAGGKYDGIANNGIADEDEDGIDHDPPEFANNLDESDTGHPWGITTRTIKGAALTIKAIFLDYENASSYSGKAYLYYRRAGETTYKEVEMKSVKGTTYAYDIDGSEVTSDIEYVFVGVDDAGNVSLCDSDSFMYSADGKDNDGDGRIDEEKNDGKDDDGDGFIDEDLGSEGTFVIRADGKCVDKAAISPPSVDNWIQNALYDKTVSYFAKPFTVKVYDDSSYVPDFSGKISKEGTIATDMDGNTVTVPLLFPGDVEITVYPKTFDKDVIFKVSVPESVPSLPSKNGLRSTGFVRQISATDVHGNPIDYFSKPVIFNFRRPLLSLDSSYLIAYLFNGSEWAPVGGERADITADQQIGYGKPLIVRSNSLGIFQVVEDYSLWNGVSVGITKLEATPKVFTPGGSGADRTIISFFFASNDAPASIGDVPLYAEVPVDVKVFDIRGNLVRTLASGYDAKFGWNQGSLIQFAWDGKDDFGNFVVPGFYVVQVQATNNFKWLTQDKDKSFFQRTGVAVIR